MKIHVYLYCRVQLTCNHPASYNHAESNQPFLQYFAILQTPISHYCNTLKSPILQIAIYLYCRVQLSDCSILKGVGQICHSPPQAATGRPTFWLQIALNPPEINEI